MTRRRLSAALAALAGAAGMQACAQQAAPAAPAAWGKTTWTVARAWCPVGCSAATAGVLQAQVGATVQLSPTRLSAPFIDACQGQVHLGLKTMSLPDIVADVNKGAAAGARQLAVADLGVSGAAATSGWALCHGAAGDLNLQRLLVVAPDRVLLLGEEQSLIELR